jgi:hypothetical protein
MRESAGRPDEGATFLALEAGRAAEITKIASVAGWWVIMVPGRHLRKPSTSANTFPAARAGTALATAEEVPVQSDTVSAGHSPAQRARVRQVRTDCL